MEVKEPLSKRAKRISTRIITHLDGAKKYIENGLLHEAKLFRSEYTLRPLYSYTTKSTKKRVLRQLDDHEMIMIIKWLQEEEGFVDVSGPFMDEGPYWVVRW